MAETTTTPPTSAPSFLTALISGGMAGTSVDVALFPIDTVKVRLQSAAGFWKAGGFRGIYNGLGAAAAGSAPGAALFFSTYETSKQYLEVHHTQTIPDPSTRHMMAASFGEIAACMVRVPTEVVKAKMQTATTQVGLVNSIKMVMQEGRDRGGNPLSHGLYRGYGMTLFREIPFAMIQFPLYERFKVEWAKKQNIAQVSPVQAAACGSLSGAIAGALTTPLDVLKTRTQLGFDRHGIAYNGISDVLRRTLQHDGHMALLNGIQPRVLWISIGGFIFFGAYETSRKYVVSPIFG